MHLSKVRGCLYYMRPIGVELRVIQSVTLFGCVALHMSSSYL